MCTKGCVPSPLITSIQVRQFSGISGKDQVHSTLNGCGYQIGKTIGEGSYCKVKSAMKICSLGKVKRVACKIVNKRRASEDYVVKFLPREVSIIRTIRHPNIVQTFDMVDVDDKLFIFMDICEQGDLLDHVRTKGAIPELQCVRLFKQLVSAIDYLHSLDISHRDLKCENILMASNNWIKLADFGFARWCRDQHGRRLLSDTFCGSAAYAAPEILQGVPYNPKMYDVWSLGCVLFIMLTSTMPFDDSEVSSMLDMQLRHEIVFPDKRHVLVSKVAKTLIFHMLEPDVTRRATISQVIRHQWLLLKQDLRSHHIPQRRAIATKELQQPTK